MLKNRKETKTYYKYYFLYGKTNGKETKKYYKYYFPHGKKWEGNQKNCTKIAFLKLCFFHLIKIFIFFSLLRLFGYCHCT